MPYKNPADRRKYRNRKKDAAYSAKYYKEHTAERLAYGKSYTNDRRATDPKFVNRCKKLSATRYSKNRLKIVAQAAIRRSSASLEKKAAVRATHRNYMRERLQTDPEFRLIHNLRKRVHLVIRNGVTTHALALTGCPIEELKAHLESLFQLGMSWENYGEWHVDHKQPCASFDLTDPAKQRECFHFNNLQPLWALDNLRKGARACRS